jgi:hypothetical protein
MQLLRAIFNNCIPQLLKRKGLVVMVVNNENRHLRNFKEPRIKTLYLNGNGRHGVKLHETGVVLSHGQRILARIPARLGLSTITDTIMPIIAQCVMIACMWLLLI